ncbi:oligosaccharide flippase family protein [Psychromonas arctica]|uniref:oligosaccharide flippase family protein n=1 Tax=Psychromonas arctica TaxID=168275 RepID=UPI000408EB24|nr:oligosaccharide flippase family protein [Psychromonas arctica]
MLLKLIQGATFSFIIALINLILLARLLPVDVVSTIKNVQLYSGIFSVLGTLQLHSGLIKFNSKLSDDEKNTSFSLFFISITMSSLVSSLVVFNLTELNDVSLIGVFLYTLANSLVVSSPSICAINHKGKEYIKFICVFMGINTACLLVSFIMSFGSDTYIVLLGIGSILSVMLSFWARLIVNNLKNIFFLISRAHRINNDLFRYSWKLSMSIFVESIYQKVDKIYATLFLTTSAFGRYSVVCFENPLIGIILSSIGVSVVSDGQQRYCLNKTSFYNEIWGDKIKLSILVIIPMSLFLMTYSKEIVNLLFGDRYSDYSVVFMIYSFVGIIRYSPLQVILRLEERSDLIFKSSVLALLSVSVCALLFYFLSVDNPILIALIYLFGWFVFNLRNLVYIKSISDIKISELLLPKFMFKVLIQSTFMIIILECFNNYTNIHFVYSIIIYGLMYITTLVLLYKKALASVLRT